MHTAAVRPEDEAILFDLYAGTRAEEVAAWGWDPAQQEAFLRMQFQVQRRGYAMQYPGGDHRMIWHEGQRVGQMLLFRERDAVRVVDISLLPRWRGSGLGTAVIGQVQAAAREGGMAVRLSVRKENQGARRLYIRLGFETVSESETHYAMEWRPSVQKADTV